MIHQYFAHSAAHLAANAQETMSLDNRAVSYHHIFSGFAYAPCVPVASRLDDDGIIALVKLAVLNQHVARHFEVDAVVVVVMGIYIQVARNATVAKEQVDSPER